MQYIQPGCNTSIGITNQTFNGIINQRDWILHQMGCNTLIGCRFTAPGGFSSAHQWGHHTPTGPPIKGTTLTPGPSYGDNIPPQAPRPTNRDAIYQMGGNIPIGTIHQLGCNTERSKNCQNFSPTCTPSTAASFVLFFPAIGNGGW